MSDLGKGKENKELNLYGDKRKRLRAKRNKSRAERTELVELVTQTRAETGKWTETQYLKLP